MPEDVLKEAHRELKRLSRMSPAAADYTVTRTYLDWLVALPWNKSSGSGVDVVKAKQVLDEDHYDLEKIKERILDYLAVLQLKPTLKGPILCFVGPPGVGKTSLGKSIARALGREFVRLSLGGVHDEAEIRGHRRTYIVALCPHPNSSSKAGASSRAASRPRATRTRPCQSSAPRSSPRSLSPSTTSRAFATSRVSWDLCAPPAPVPKSSVAAAK